jgi:hypothetical protein
MKEQTRKDPADAEKAAQRVEQIVSRIDAALKEGAEEANGSVRRAIAIGEDLRKLKQAAKAAKQKFGEVVAARFTFSKQWRARVMKLAEHKDDVERLLDEDATAYHSRSVDGMYKAIMPKHGGDDADGEKEKKASRKELEAENERLKEELNEAHSEIEKLRSALKKADPNSNLLRLNKSSRTGLLKGGNEVVPAQAGAA